MASESVRDLQLVNLIAMHGADEAVRQWQDGKICFEPLVNSYLQHAIYAAQAVKVIEKVAGAVVKEIELTPTRDGPFPTRIVFDGKILL